jgi:hypothetical protein
MKASLLCLLLIPIFAHGYVAGGGEVELGLSKDKEDHNFGLSVNYGLESKTSNSQSSLLTKIQLGSDEGRSLVATSAHEYQYEQSFIQTEIDNSIQFYYPGLSLNSRFAHSLEFQKESDSPEADSSTNYNNPLSNWAISIGPSFSYDRSKWFAYRTALTVSKAVRGDDNSLEGNATIGLGKRLSPLTDAYFDISNVCTSYGNTTQEDACRNELRLSLSSNRSNADIQLEVGVSEQEDIKTNLYLFRVENQINSYSKINFEIQKSIESITELSNIVSSGDIAFTSAEKESQSIVYVYDWGRKKVEVKARSYQTTVSDITVATKDSSIFYTYQLGSRVCIACDVGVSYEYSDYGDDRNQIIKSIEINKVHGRKLSSSISFRRTQIQSELDTWSVNLLLSYKGLLTKLGKR